jgi:hypothetical protein
MAQGDSVEVFEPEGHGLYQDVRADGGDVR